MKYIKRYCDKILNEEIRSCEEQKLLCRYVLECFENEDLRIDEDKVEGYFSLEKYFRFGLFDWERFCFVLHCCTYRADGFPRWPDMFGYMGRGSGKNGFTSFEDLSLLSPKNGIRGYNIQSFAAAEDNAKTSFEEVRLDVLTENENRLKKFFTWNKEEILCVKTKSRWTYHTSAPRTKDGGRPGKVNIDEIHVFENTKLLDVAFGGLGKVKDPRRLITSTDGLVRDGPLDYYKAKGRAVLKREIDDNGLLPFLCHCTLDQIDDPENWIMAIPSLDEFPVLREQVRKDYIEYKENPFERRSVIVKRFNCIEGEDENALTSWENIQECCKGLSPADIPEIKSRPCVFGIDFASIDDFASAVILTLADGIYYAEQHSWYCSRGRDIPRIRFPLEEAEARGELTKVDGSEIPPEMIIEWVEERTQGRRLLAGAGDNFRYSYVKRACDEILRMPGEARRAANGYGTKPGIFYYVRPSDLAKAAPEIATAFNHHSFHCGDTKIMRWYMSNVKKTIDSHGNTAYEKIEAKSRKTDGAMALFAAMTVAPMLTPYDKKSTRPIKRLGVKIYS